MQRNARYYRDKKLLAFERELKALRTKSVIMVPLDPPEDRGWVQHFRLTRTAAQRPDAPALRTILLKLDCKYFSATRRFGPGESWERQRRLHYTGLSLRSVSLNNWPWREWPREWMGRYFSLERRFVAGLWTVDFLFKHDEFFEVFSERHYVREVPLHDPAQKERIAELQAQIGAAGRSRLEWLHGRTTWRWIHKDYRAIKTRLARRRLRLALQGDLEAERKRQTSRPFPFTLPIPAINYLLPA